MLSVVIEPLITSMAAIMLWVRNGRLDVAFSFLGLLKLPLFSIALLEVAERVNVLLVEFAVHEHVANLWQSEDSVELCVMQRKLIVTRRQTNRVKQVEKETLTLISFFCAEVSECDYSVAFVFG